MFINRKRSASSFGPDGRRIAPLNGRAAPSPTQRTIVGGIGHVRRSSSSLGSEEAAGGRPSLGGSRPSLGASRPSLGGSSTSSNDSRSGHRSSKLLAPGVKLKVMRAPILNGLTASDCGAAKKFQRPLTGRRSYDKRAESALRECSLGQRRRMDGMSKLLARAGKGLTYKLPDHGGGNEDDTDEERSDDEEDAKEEDRPFEPLCVWKSPHQGGERVGLPCTVVTEMQPDEFGIEQPVKVRRAPPLSAFSKENVLVPPVLAKWLRPHQREGVTFMYECVMGMKSFDGNGCILADDMGLGKTLQSVTLIYSLLKTGVSANGQPTAKRVIVVCPCSLVKNWENEFVKWLGAGAVKIMALAESDRKTIEKNLDVFVRTRMFNVLIASYECLRTHVGRLNKHEDCCDLLVADEAHRLKNNENQTSQALNSLPVRRRVLLTGTPMQNDLQEFFAMVNFTNPGVLGTQEEFRRNCLYPVLRGREPDATEAQRAKMRQVQNDMSRTVNEFILRRINTVNAQHLPPKLVQVVCCNLTEIQQNMYQHLVNSKDMQHVLDGKQVNCLSSIQMLMKLCNHPSLVADEDPSANGASVGTGRRAAAKKVTTYVEDAKSSAAPGADGVAKFLPHVPAAGGRSLNAPVHPEWSGKMFVLYRLMREMRKPGNGNDKIVIVSNYTQTLDLIGRMCRENNWGFCRLDGSITMKKRQKMVDEFNDPTSSLVAFLLSSKAGGCGLNLIGGNRLVLYDPDWNPAVDKQAAARCWRDGQKKRCFTYRFLATGTVDEKIFQRQLSKEGLQSVVDDKEQVNELSTKDLRNLFKLRTGTPSDTHDKLRCERCKIIVDNAEMEAKKVLPKQLASCKQLLERMMQHDDAARFVAPLNPVEEGVSADEYDKLVRQPIDLGTISTRLDSSSNNGGLTGSYKNVSAFSKDVNRIFSNVMKVWSPGQDIADAARRLQSWWVDEWTNLVPVLMSMKPDTSDEADGTEDDHDNKNLSHHDNERGDDYQDQIGMPDEENMRHWSHHHSPDTVDDPIFRAAMRGYDTVSFVFGLEVTWSLIQQRKQEEEERAAMMELEAGDDQDGKVSLEEEDSATEEREGNDNDDVAGAQSPTKMAKTASSDEEENEDEDEEWTLSKTFSLAELQTKELRQTCSTDGCNLVACAVWRCNKNGADEECHTCKDCMDSEFGGWPSEVEPMDPNHLSTLQKLCTTSEAGTTKGADVSAVVPMEVDTHRAGNDRASLSSVESMPCEDGDDKWICGKCTFVNDESSTRKCSMCNARRSAKTKKRKSDEM